MVFFGLLFISLCVFFFLWLLLFYFSHLSLSHWRFDLFMHNIYCTRLLTFICVFRFSCNWRPAAITTGWDHLFVALSTAFFFTVFFMHHSHFSVFVTSLSLDAHYLCSNFYTFCAALVCMIFSLSSAESSWFFSSGFPFRLLAYISKPLESYCFCNSKAHCS